MSIKDKVISIITEQLNVKRDEVKETANLVKDLGADSLDGVEIIMYIEDEFGLEISDEDAMKLKTVGDIIKYLKDKGINDENN